MKRIRISLWILALILSLGSCLKPDPIEDDSVVKVSPVDILETVGFARDVVVYEENIFVAASQAGTQIWQDQNGTVTQIFNHYFSNDNPALRVLIEPQARIMLAFDKKKVYLKQLNPTLTAFDSVYTLHSVWIPIFESETFYDANMKDFAFSGASDSTVTLLSTDTDLGDGLRHASLSRSYDSDQGFYYWEVNPIAKYSNKPILGLDLKDTLLAAAHDELGIGLYQLIGADLDTLETVDTPGQALDVKFYKDYLLSANNWGGLGIYDLGSDNRSLSHLADVDVNGWVKQISIWNDMAVLSCGENGVFLVDLSDPAQPRVDQALETGYTYRTFVANNMIYAATREGVKRYRIESR